MTRFAKDASSFRGDLLAGFTDAYRRYVEQVPETSGVICAGGAKVGKVATILGGGSGHYPAFCGLVGEGLADAAVVGDVFTSPSAEQAYRTARAADGGAGVLYSFGNYAGDVLNFAVASRRLEADGIDVRTVLVTDDVASAPPDEAASRRGIAGGLVVFKTAGAAAARGADLDEVERLARKANANTRTMGVAFAGCTLPGWEEPLFEVPEDVFEIGMGIHGEPGIRQVKALSAPELAAVMAEPLLAERPAGADPRTAVILNGLGSTKYEELFTLWHCLLPRLEQAGLEVVMPEVAEFVTSLDMAGCSLTMTWLDDELAELWTDPADTPAFRRPAPREAAATAPKWTHRRNNVEGLGVDAGPETPTASSATNESKEAAGVARDALAAMLAAVREHEAELGRLDAFAGDGDHGSGMVRGLTAAVRAADGVGQGAGIGGLLRAAGRAFADDAGGTSGVLWGLMLEAVGERLGDTDGVDGPRLAAAVSHGIDEVGRIGRAQVGDKTMLDAAVPFADSLRGGVEAGASLAAAWTTAAEVAVAAGSSTAALSPRVGRARPLAERSVGHPDPGAVSFGVSVTAVGELLNTRDGGAER
ncbi:MAG TPA: dihydroxyacetone kinase family protein [Acidimicrobiales bacterium]|nr:dihydroxyacetone kinase family protein [Acidimicrobiales bacterium]